MLKRSLLLALVVAFVGPSAAFVPKAPTLVATRQVRLSGWLDKGGCVRNRLTGQASSPRERWRTPPTHRRHHRHHLNAPAHLPTAQRSRTRTSRLQIAPPVV